MSRLQLGVVCLILMFGCSDTPRSESGRSGLRVPSSPTAPTMVPILPVPATVPPTLSGIVVLPLEVGISGVTEFSFQGTGLGGSNLIYAWDFDDGVGASTQTARHIYMFSGVYQVQFSVSNSAGSASMATFTTVKDLGGRWRINIDLGKKATIDLIQNGSRLIGTYFDDIGDVPNAMIEASNIIGRRVQFRAVQVYSNRTLGLSFDGLLNPTADKVCGFLNVVSSFVMVREGSALSGDFTNDCRQ